MAGYKVKSLLRPFERFIHAESTAGVVLFLAAAMAMIWANSPWKEHYHHLWEQPIGVRAGTFEIEKPLHHWINDGLMAMFFFVVGLELKREVIAGELSNVRKALLPLMAAVGGMVVPALIFIIFNKGGDGINGWGIPMATDIAFALGIIALLGKRVPASLKVFLTALAIADDLGAVLVIAFFYTSNISFVSLATGAAFLVILLVANRLGIRSTLFYGVVGIGGVWVAFLMSGVHATIAGVLAAMVIPARTKIDERYFADRLLITVEEFRRIPPNDVSLLETEQLLAIEKINHLTRAAATPLQHLEHTLHHWVALFIMPLFALANAGIELHANIFSSDFFHGVGIGVLCGLVAGKFAGVVGVSWLMKTLGWATFPENMKWGHLYGAGFLAGIGFTMSLFITNLAYDDPMLIAQAKIGIFAASIICGIIGYYILKQLPVIKQDESTPTP